MSKPMGSYATEQENFWAGSFGTDYIGRNQSPELLASNLHFFSQALGRAGKIGSCIEFGANVGMNLRALRLLYPHAALSGIEINPDATRELASWLGAGQVLQGSILELTPPKLSELVLIKGVLIHQNPDVLPTIYRKLYEASSRYVLVCEYFNPSPVTVSYRGHADRLFKRDFAGEMLDAFPDLKLVDYGFAYRHDPAFPQDDITWFLMEKKA